MDALQMKLTQRGYKVTYIMNVHFRAFSIKSTTLTSINVSLCIVKGHFITVDNEGTIFKFCSTERQ
jgi:hypothetical protein